MNKYKKPAMVKCGVLEQKPTERGQSEAGYQKESNDRTAYGKQDDESREICISV